MVDFWSSGLVIKRIQVFSLIWCLVLVLLGGIFVSVFFSLGVLAGGIIASLNFYWFQKALQKLFDENVVLGSKAFFYLKYCARFVIISVALYLLLIHRMVHPLGLVVGSSVVVINIMILAFSELWKIIRTKEAI